MVMTEANLINTGLLLYGAASLSGIVYLINRGRALYRISLIIATGGFAALALGMAHRWFEAGRPPLTNIYETLVFFGWAAWLVSLLILVPRKMEEIAVLTSLVPTACLSYASTLDSSIRPLMPALRSNWLTIHVAANFLGYAGFAAAFLSAIRLAVGLRRGGDLRRWERATVSCIRFGFIFLTYGILTGSVWANEAWTTYWGWDPKETWALLTWIFYFLFLLMRENRGQRERSPKRAALFSSLFGIGGFFFVLFTYFGVSYLLRGLHSYL